MGICGLRQTNDFSQPELKKEEERLGRRQWSTLMTGNREGSEYPSASSKWDCESQGEALCKLQNMPHPEN
jgi:hypothetical protein